METKTKYIIEGDVITRHKTEYQKYSDGTEKENITRQQVSVNDFWTNIQKELVTKTTVISALPTGCGRICGTAEKGNKMTVAVELPPAVRSLRGLFTNEGMDSEKLFKISFPFVILIGRFIDNCLDRVYLYYRNEPILEEGDFLFHTNLPNVDSDDHLCWGGSSIDNGQPIYAQVTAIWKAFWQSQFNKDWYGKNFTPATKLEGHPKNFSEWQKKTAENPGFILNIPWQTTGKTIKQKLSEVLNG